MQGEQAREGGPDMGRSEDRAEARGSQVQAHV